MMASRLNPRERVIPALTDHLEDKGGVIGLKIQYKGADSVNQKPQSSSAPHVTAGAFGFLTFIQCAELQNTNVRFGSKADIQRCVPIRIDAGFHKPADIVTCPVLYNPMARAAAGDRSMSLPRTHGPRSLMRTVTHPLWQTHIWVPNGSLRWAAVIAAQFSRSPLAVLWPHSPSLPP